MNQMPPMVFVTGEELKQETEEINEPETDENDQQKSDENSSDSNN